MNFPSRHPLNQSFRRGIISQADVILAIEMNDLWGAVTAFSDRIVRRSRPLTKPGAKIVTLGVRDLYLKSNYQDFGRFQDIDLDIAGDGEASLPALAEAVKREIDAGRKSAFEARGKKLEASLPALAEAVKREIDAGRKSAFEARGKKLAARHHWLGREPDHDGAHVRRGLCPDQGRRLVASRHLDPADMAAPAVGL
jgi:hypothetical protein